MWDVLDGRAWCLRVASTGRQHQSTAAHVDVQLPYYVRRHSSVESARTPWHLSRLCARLSGFSDDCQRDRRHESETDDVHSADRIAHALLRYHVELPTHPSKAASHSQMYEIHQWQMKIPSQQKGAIHIHIRYDTIRYDKLYFRAPKSWAQTFVGHCR